MCSNRNGPERLTDQLRRRHEYVVNNSDVEEQRPPCRNKRRNPLRDLGNETMRAAREQHQESLKRLVDHVWADYQRIKAREYEEMERIEASTKMADYCQSYRSASSPSPREGRRSPPSPSPSPTRRDPANNSSSPEYRGLNGLNDRYREVVRSKNASRGRPERNQHEMAHRRQIDALTNPRAGDERLNSQIRQHGRERRIVKKCQPEQCEMNVSEEDGPSEDYREFERFVKSEAARLDSALQAAEDDLYLISKRRNRLKPNPPQMAPHRSKQDSRTNRCNPAPQRSRPSKRAPRDDHADSVMELHPFKSRTASGRQWTDAESKSTMQFNLQIEENYTTTSCSDVSGANTEDLEVIEKMLMELESNVKGEKFDVLVLDEESREDVVRPNNINQIRQMVSAEERDVSLALKMARQSPANRPVMSSNCPALRKSANDNILLDEVEGMTPRLAAKMMEAEERGISGVSPPQKMFACLFPDEAHPEHFIGIGGITMQHGLVVPLHGAHYQSPFSKKDMADLSMMSEAAQASIGSSVNTSMDPGAKLGERGSLADSADIIGWNAMADSECAPEALTSFDTNEGNALIYTLKPTELATNIRLRGSTKPSWFPGYYMILSKHSDITLATTPSQALFDAHNALQPDRFNRSDPKMRPICRC